MNDWKLIKQEIILLEKNNFIEISLKQPPKGDNLLIALSKGWIKEDGKKLYKSNILFPKSKKEELISILNSIDEI